MSASPVAVAPETSAPATTEATGPVDEFSDSNAVESRALTTKQDGGSVTENSDTIGAPDRAEQPTAVTSIRQELVFVDTSASDYQQLIDDITHSADDSRSFQVFTFDAERDGVQQISDLLSDYRDVDAVHIVSHGTAGNVKLGNSWLNLNNLSAYAPQLGSWSDALTSDADLLIYGCDLAATSEGTDFVEALSLLTGADVAASDDLTGHATLGGDWQLEFASGAIESQVAFSSDLQQSWFGILPNAAPVLNLPAGPVNYTASDPLTVIDATATVTDADSPDFNTGTLTVDFTANGTGNDRLKIDTTGDFNLQGANVRYQPGGPPTTIGTWTGGTDGSTPLLITFNNDATPAIVQELIRSIGYENVAAVPSGAPRTVRFVVSDGDGGTSTEETEIINILGGNAAPSITLQSTAVTFTEDTAPVVVDDSLLVSDADTPNLSGATVSIAGNFASGQDLLAYDTTLATSLGIGGSYDGGTGVLTLTGSRPPGDYQQVLRTVTYENTSDNPNTAQRTVTFEVDDGLSRTTDSRPVNITAANDAPTAANSTASASEDASYAFTIADFNFSDPDFDALSKVRITSLETVGALKLSGADVTLNQEILAADISDGELTYLALPEQFGPSYDSFLFEVHDGTVFSATSYTMDIDVAATNDAPVNSVPGTQSTPVDTPLTFSTANSNLISVGDIDAGANNLEVTLNVTNGTVTLDLPVSTATPIGGETIVNTTLGQTQAEAVVAIRDTGDYVIAWSGKGGGGESDGVWIQLYDQFGTPDSGGNIQVNTETTNVQSDPAIAMDDAGNFVVVWTSVAQDGDLRGIYGQRFDASGNAVGVEFQINTSWVDNQREASVAMDADGDFVVVWEDKSLDGHNEGIFGQRFNSLGVAQGVQFQVNTVWTDKQIDPHVAMDAAGNFVVTWSDSGARDGHGHAVFAQRFDKDGTALGGEFQVNTNWDKDQIAGDIAMNAAGDFVIVWTSSQQDFGGTEGVYGQRYDASGNPVGGEFRINSTVVDDQENPSVSMSASGGFVVTWESVNQDNPGELDGGVPSVRGIYAQQFDSDGNPLGGEALVNSTVSGHQVGPDVAMTAAGDFVIAWDGNGTGDDQGVFHQRYRQPSPPLTFSAGDGYNDSFVRLQGSLADINAALDGMVFTPTPSFTGAANLNIDVNDLGNTGTGGPLSDNDNITINVNGANTPIGPVSDSDGTTDEVNENAAIGATVGITASATDPDVADTVSYFLDNDAGGLFDIHSVTGVVTVKAALDYETATSHNITVRATSSDLSSTTQGFTINVLPFNDNNPVITSDGGGSTAAINIAENSTAVTTVVATDADLPTQTLSYSITGGVDQSLFNINSSSGALNFVAAPDFETPADADTDNIYEVTVQVSDGAGGTDTQNISVTVTDVGLIAYESFSYGAGSLNGASGGTGFSTAWTLEGGSSALVNATGLTSPPGLAASSGGTLEMNTTSQFTQSRNLNTTLGADGTTAWFSYLLRPDNVFFGGISLIVGDAGPNNYINVGHNGNDFLLGIDGTATGDTIDNVVLSGQTYYMAARIDFAAGNDTVTLYVNPTPGVSSPDSPPLMTAQITTADLGSFSRIGVIGGFSGNSANIDEIRVGDTYADVSPAALNSPPDITSDGGAATAALNVAENGTAVTTVTATDADLPAQTLTYSLIGGADQALFNINSTSGALTFVSAPDFETPADADTDNIYHVTVQVSDGVGGTDTQNISVTVTDANDVAPTVTASQNFNVDEDASNSTSVGTVAATDPDTVGALTNWTITGGNTDGIFAINSSTGELTIVDNTNLNYESTTSYTLSIQVQDGTNTSAIETVNVDINDVFEGILIVDTTADVIDGNVSSASALLSNRGADGKISLREAIAALNVTANTGSPDEIHFNFADNDPGHLYYREDFAAGLPLTPTVTTLDDGSITDFDSDYPYAQHSWFRIDLDSMLPQLEIDDAVIINGYTQAGASQNTLTTGNDAVLRVELTNSAADGNHGISVNPTADGTSILGMVVNDFTLSAILVKPGADNVTIQGNFLGTDITGSRAIANGEAGVTLRSSNNLVGGAAVADRNILSGNTGHGITTFTTGAVQTGNVVRNNYIGVDATGMNPLGNQGQAAVEIYNNDGFQLLDNVIAADAGHGVWLRSSTSVDNTIIQGNLIGVLADGTTSAGNAGAGIYIDESPSSTTIGGLLPGQGNVIANSGTDGISAENGTGTAIRGNAIYSNGGIGIDLNNDGVTFNDLNDLDGGPNGRQNFPVLSSATITGADLTVAGTLNSSVLSAFEIDFYGSVTSDPTGNGQAERYLGSASVFTDALGNASFSELLSGVSVVFGEFVTATATDAAGNTSEFAVNVVASGTSVGLISDSDSSVDSVPENATVGTAVGITAFAADPDSGDTVSYSLDNDAGGRFAINATTGVVSVIGMLDAETATSHNITVRATSTDTSFSTAGFTIAVTDVDESDTGPITDTDATPDAVNENAASGTTVGVTAFAADPDVGDNVTYSLSVNPGNLFAIDSTTGVITTNAVLDAESATSHNITVLATSDDASTSTLAVTIAVNDVNETPVSGVSDTNGMADTVLETAANGTAVGITAFAVDPDVSDTVTYSLDDSASGRFAIDATTGVVTVASASLLDYETTTSHNITVRATSTDSSSSTLIRTITLIDDPLESGVSAISDANSAADSVAENATVGTPVGITAFAADPDSGDTISYSLDNDAGGRFAINATTGVVSVIGLLDAETATSHNITVRATSTDTSFSTAGFTIAVTDVDESDTGPITDTDATPDAVNENAASGTTVGVTAFAVDPDVSDNVTYSLSVNPGNLFAIDSTTGVITTNAVLDAESATSHNITVLATSDDASTSTLAVTITVNDVNETPVSAIVDVNSAADTVTENAAFGTVIGVTAQASDADLTDGVTYSLSSNPGNLFAIDTITGVVSVNGGIDYESAVTHDITILATSTDGTTATKTITVAVSDTNDNAPVVLPGPAVTVPENAPNGTVSGSVVATDADSVGTLSNWKIVSGNDDGIFAMNPVTGLITIVDNSPLNSDTAASHSLGVSVSDGVNTSAVVHVTVTVERILVNLPTVTEDHADADESAHEETTVNDIEHPIPQSISAESSEIPAGNATPSGHSSVSEPQDNVGQLAALGSLRNAAPTQEYEPYFYAIDVIDQALVVTTGLRRIDPGGIGDSADSNPLDSAYLVRHLGSAFAINGETSRYVDELLEDLKGDINFDDVVVEAVTTVGAGLTVGYIVWAVRGGMLLTGLLANMPLWTMMDPLLVVDGVVEDDDGGESVQDIVDQQDRPSDDVRRGEVS